MNVSSASTAATTGECGAEPGCAASGEPVRSPSPRHSAPNGSGQLELEPLSDHARALARSSVLLDRPGLGRLRSRFERVVRGLAEARRLLDEHTADGSAASPAIAWFLDNDCLLRTQVLALRRQLPHRRRSYLPRLAGGPLDGLPRVFQIAVELIGRTEGRLDDQHLQRFIGAYQQVVHLTLGELWALPLMLRLALLERIQRLAAGLGDARRPAQRTDELAMSNSINGLRRLDDLDWKQFVEEQSATERILRRDPAGVHGRMTFAGRDTYRRVVEILARRSACSEEQVAAAAVEHARRSAVRTDRRGHVGYYLVDRGRRQLEASIGYRPARLERLARPAARFPLAFYLGAIAVAWLLAVAGAAAIAVKLGAARTVTPVALAALAVTGAAAALQFATSIVNWIATLVVPCRRTMRLDFATGIPREHRALVVVPTLLTDVESVQAIVDQLEVRYLGNSDENLLFALVTDFADAATESLPADARLLKRARSGIRRLNHRHCRNRPPVFYLLHRPRTWNPREGVWMGEERKRGKLAAVNRLLRTGSTDAFALTVGDLDELSDVRYVITLDTDTWLPPDVGRDLVGCMAHPLNRPRIDPRTGLVVEGHAILQPRVSTTIPEADRSRYARLTSVAAGIDPYTLQTSDVYEDVFGQGSFIGKGIYDVEAFEAVLDQRFPDNRVLSHDLIEGCFARSGLVNDLELFEGCPARLLSDMSRQHRWIRGDWQIAAWLGSAVPSRRGFVPNPLGGLARWKIIDNLRRSLHPLFLLAFPALGWCLAPALASLWTSLALALVLGSVVLASVPGFVRKPQSKPWRLHLADQSGSFARGCLRELLAIVVLPYRVHCHVDAIVRTLYRLHVSGRKLLQWTTACDAEDRSAGGCREHYELMWASTVCSLTLTAALLVRFPQSLIFAGPLLLAWLAGPCLAWRCSRCDRPRPLRFAAQESRQFRRWARHTWQFFETHVGPHNRWLPPDHVRDLPQRRTWPLTSPTNIGLGLLSELTAADLGYLSAGRLVHRLQRTFHTLDRLPRYRGHFYNWYDIGRLEPTQPAYVSSVDSGNLWGALLVLQAGLEELKDAPLVAPRLFEGLHDTLDALASFPSQPGGEIREQGLRRGFARLRSQTAAAQATRASDARRFFDRLGPRVARLAAARGVSWPGWRPWTRALLRQCSAAIRELRLLAFWSDLRLPEPSSQCLTVPAAHRLARLQAHLDTLDQRCTLREIPAAAAKTRRLVDRLSAALNPTRESSLAALADYLRRLRCSAARAAATARKRLRRIDALATRCGEFAEMDFGFLFHPRKKLLAIGFDVTAQRRDENFYDLLASESRLASFLAVSHGHVLQEHWFTLGRPMTLADGKPTLLSWSGSMFEYLMPLLLMPSYPGTLLESTCRAAVRRQMRFGRRQGTPWGISESCYHHEEANHTYAYRAFGVPGLRLERRSDSGLVIAPYAAALAAIVAPQASCANLQRLERLGCLTDFGFYDAIDYAPEGRISQERPAACRSVMAHHSGMTLLALAHVVLGAPLLRRFLAHPRHRAYSLLLQERRSLMVQPVDPRELPAAHVATVERWRKHRRQSDLASVAAPADLLRPTKITAAGPPLAGRGVP